MHIPDGFLNVRVSLGAGAMATAGLGMALRNVRRTLPAQRVPLMGLTSAFVFAAQMLNFPVAGGTSGHLIGAVLVAVLLGPGAAVVVMSSVLILQCLLFADGGITALGANIFNMAMVAPGVGYGVYLLVRRLAGDGVRSLLFATAFAAWCSTVAASVVCTGQLALSGTVAWRVVLPAMLGVHALIGFGEALITTLVVAALVRTRPELLADRLPSPQEHRYVELAAYGLLVSIGLAVFVAPFASGWPDGLEKVAAALGFDGKATGQTLVPSPLPDYTVRGVDSTLLSALVVGCLGTLTAFVVAYLLARLLTPRKTSDADLPL